MNPVLLLVRDNLEMTKRCVESILAQDIPTILQVVDNSDHDDVKKWGHDNDIFIYSFRPQIGVSRGWNFGLNLLFGEGYSHVLCPNNDTILSPWTYRMLLEMNLPFVTGVSVGDPNTLRQSSKWESPAPCPDFSLFAIRRDCWDAVGEFDDSMFLYASDCDYHVRAHALGIPLLNSGVPFYHERSSTIKLATPDDRRAIEQQANLDRAAFMRKWGCLPGTPEYAQLFK